MDYKKTNAPLTTTVHDIIEMAKPTSNIYETCASSASEPTRLPLK